MSKKINNIQALRGIAALLVVFYHLVKVELKYGGSETVLSNYLNVGLSGVDLFFVISGFVMVTITRQTDRGPGPAARFMYHRISRIYPTYWFYSILVLGVYLLQPSWVNSSQGGQVDILASFLLLPQKQLPLVMVGWTLIHEMYFYIVFASLLLFLPVNKMITGIILWAIFILFVPFFKGEVSGPYIQVAAHPLTLEFIGGCLVAHLYHQVSEKKSWGWTPVLISFLILFGVYVFYQFMMKETEPGKWERIFLFGLPAILIVYFSVMIELNSHITFPRWLSHVGDASYSIYLSHILVLSAMGRLWSSFQRDGIVDNLIALPVMLASVLLFGFASFFLIEKNLLRLSRNNKM